MSIRLRVLPLAAVALAISTTLAACGSDDSDSAAPSDSTAGVEQAVATVDEHTNDTEFKIEALPSTPPAGKVVAQVTCNLPSCGVDAFEAPTEALQWELNVYEYDLAKGPQDLVRAFEQALDAKPDYISLTLVFPAEIVKDQMARAEAEGIPVVFSGAQELDGAAALIQGPGVLMAAGALAADAALADAGGAVNAVLPLDPSAATGVNIAKGATQELEKLSPDSKAEQVDLSFAQPAATNASAIINYLKSHPDAEYIILGGTTLYAGLQQALQAAGLVDKVKLILTFPFPNDVELIEKGEFASTVAGEANYQWRQVDVMARLSVGQEITDKEPLSSFRIVTQDNVTPESINPPDYVNVYTTAWGV